MAKIHARAFDDNIVGKSFKIGRFFCRVRLGCDWAIFFRSMLGCDGSVFAVVVEGATTEGAAGEEARAHALMTHGQDP